MAFDRVVAVDENFDLPTEVRQRLAVNLGDGSTPEGAAIAGEPRVFTATQTFDEDAGFAIGDKLKLTFVDGFFGQRLHLTGLPQAPGEDDIMPYLEVVPTTQTGTDVGGAIAGFQVYRTIGGGGVPNREFLAIEASGNDATLPGFKIATWASGTGQVMPLRFVIGANEVLRMVPNAGAAPARTVIAATSQIYGNGPTPLLFERSAGSLTALAARLASAVNTPPVVFLARNRGDVTTPTAPGSGDLLGDHRFGSYNGVTEVPGAIVRAVATEAWNFGVAQGTLLRFRGTPAGSASAIDLLDLKDPTDANDTALMVSVNRAGVKTISRVAVGPADSAGTGFRYLRVAN